MRAMPTNDIEGLQPSARLWDNPLVKGLVWVVGGAFTLVTASLGVEKAVDARYAKQYEIAEVKQDLLAQVGKFDKITKTLETQIEYQADANRKRALDTELMKYDLTPEGKRTQVDKAMAKSYRREINEMTDRWNNAGKPLK